MIHRTAAALLLAGVIVSAANAQLRTQHTYGRVPLYFEENRGQSDPSVRFIARGAGYPLFITQTGAVAVLSGGGDADAPPAVLRMSLGDANPNPAVRGERLRPGKSHYFIGNDASRWHTNVPHYSGVRLEEVYRGVDVVFHGNRRFEYDLVVKPGADTKQIVLRFEGAERIDVDPKGDLVLHTTAGDVIQTPPEVYQEEGERRTRVRAAYRRISGREFGFDVASHDRSRPLIIDPVVVYTRSLAGSREESVNSIAVDADGSAYVGGHTASKDFPTTANALWRGYRGGSFDVFVAKLDPSGSDLVYATYLGASGHTVGGHIAVDDAGNVYVAGMTDSAFFPLVNAIDSTLAGFYDAFVLKLNATGSAIVYSTLLGGSLGKSAGSDGATAIAVDSAGSLFVGGVTTSPDFPTVNAFQTSYGGNLTDAFICKLNPSGTALVFSTYVGGAREEELGSIAVDEAGNAYLSGVTASLDFPTAAALQPANAGMFDLYVAKLSATGALLYSTYIGGSQSEERGGMALDSAGNVTISGSTESADFPMVNALYPVKRPLINAFVTKLNTAGSAMIYSTYFPASAIAAIDVDPAGNAFLAMGGGQITVSELNAAGSASVFTTEFGGPNSDTPTGIKLDRFGDIYVCGNTTLADGAPHLPTGSDADGFIAKLTKSTADLTLSMTHTGSPPAPVTFIITVSNLGPGSTVGPVTVVDTLPSGLTATAMAGEGWACTLATLTCTRNDVLAAGASYPPINLDATISADGTFTNSAAIIGASETDSTNDGASAVVNASSAVVPTLQPLAAGLLIVLLAALALLVRQ